MGQLEAYGPTEIYVAGLLVAIFIGYQAEKNQSTSFERKKPPFHSSSFALLARKVQRLALMSTLVVTAQEKAAYRS
jgi:hypothetical protein